MTYIEPVLLDIAISGDDISLAQSGNLEIKNWSKPQNWILNNIVGEEYTVIDSEKLSNKIEKSLTELYQEVDKIHPTISQNVITRITRYLGRGIGPVDPGTVLVRDGLVILTSSEGWMYLLGEDKEIVDSTYSGFDTELTDLMDIASDFGIDVELMRGEELAERISENFGAEIVERKQFDNDFESDIYDEIRRNITSSLDDNLVLRFGENDPETFEYDIIVNIGLEHRIIIEVKDASHDKADLGKSKLINTPRDKTDIVNSQTDNTPAFRGYNTDCFVVVRGMEGQKFDQLRKQANRRDISIIEHDDKGNYLEEIENSVMRLAGIASNT